MVLDIKITMSDLYIPHVYKDDYLFYKAEGINLQVQEKEDLHFKGKVI